MINSIILLIVILGFIESSILFLSNHSKTKKFFDVIPSVFWIYFIPMLLSTFGVITAQSPLYSWTTTYVLPASLFLLLLGVDLPAVMRLGVKGIMLFAIGAFGMMLGTVVSFSLIHPVVGKDFWMGFGALSASWTGGSANMVAVKEAMGTPDNIFTPMVVVDTVVPYLWMAILVACSGRQKIFNRWTKADEKMISEMEARLGKIQTVMVKWQWPMIVMILVISFVVSWTFNYFCGYLPVIKGIISTYTWVIIGISMLGLVLSLTPLRKLEEKGSTKIGYFLLYFVLTTIGAKASITNLGDSAILIGAGILIVIVHAIVLLIGGYFVRAPLSLLASASQANIGGVASAPVVAEIYQPGLASVGLLMAILGNIVGTYLGIITAQICRTLVSG